VVRLGVPKDLNNFVKVDSKTSLILHKAGFQPYYKDKEDLYYVRNNKILEFMMKGGLTK
jgi:hypothetical protein